MNTRRNAHAKMYLTDMAAKAGLRAHVSQDGMKAVWSYKTQPIALVSLKELEIKEEEQEIVSENAKLISRVFMGANNATELLAAIIRRSDHYQIDMELFAGVPEEARSKILANIEKFEQSLGLRTREPKTRPKQLKRTPLKKSGQTDKRYPKLIEEYVFAA